MLPQHYIFNAFPLFKKTMSLASLMHGSASGGLSSEQCQFIYSFWGIRENTLHILVTSLSSKPQG